MLSAPFSSEYDPSEEAEGSIDPLGLQPAYERLADRILPAVTVRMGRPRFVTAMAVGARVCDAWGADSIAADGITPPWLVYEWFVVEAFVRAADILRDKKGIPGSQKVERALRNQRPVSDASYLKTPTVFGFSGIFRRLAKHIGVLTDEGRLDDGGYELVAAWERDHGLPGFLDGASGDGHSFLARLQRAVSQGMAKGATTSQPGDFWREIAARLDPSRPGRREAHILLERIKSRSGPQEMVSAVIEALLARKSPLEVAQEPSFLRRLSDRTSPELSDVLSAIDVYEAFCRVATDVFNDIRYLSSNARGALISAQEFAALKSSASKVEQLGESLKRIRAHPRLLQWQPTLGWVVNHFEGVRGAQELFEATLTYHERVQANKPPEGKRAWFERGRQQRILVRPAYLLHERLNGGNTYVHEYRLPTFSRFFADLGAYK